MIIIKYKIIIIRPFAIASKHEDDEEVFNANKLSIIIILNTIIYYTLHLFNSKT